MAEFGLTGVRLQQFNQLPQYANDGAGQANRRYQIMLLQRKQRASDKAIAKRDDLRVAREALERVHARELKKQADIEAKRLRDIRIERDLALARAKREEINRKARERRVAKKNNVLMDEILVMDKTNLIVPCNKLVGKKEVYIQISYGNKILSAGIHKIKGNDGEAVYWNVVFPLVDGYDEYDEDKIHTPPDGSRIVVLDTNVIPSIRIQQSFRDGDTHCVIEPLVNLWESMDERSESDASKKRCTQIANKIRKLEDDEQVVYFTLNVKFRRLR